MTPEAKIQRTRAWLRYSARDMSAARLLLKNAGGEASPYQAAFWAQQAAEKALKGALTYAGVPFEATHRLNALAAALPDDWEARRGRGALTELTSYGVETRYPDVGEPEPTVEDARRAITQAAAVQQAVRRDLEAHGFPFQQRPAPQQASQEPERDDADLH